MAIMQYISQWDILYSKRSSFGSTALEDGSATTTGRLYLADVLILFCLKNSELLCKLFSSIQVHFHLLIRLLHLLLECSNPLLKSHNISSRRDLVFAFRNERASTSRGSSLDCRNTVVIRHVDRIKKFVNKENQEYYTSWYYIVLTALFYWLLMR